MRSSILSLLGLKAVTAVQFIAELSDTSSVADILGERYAQMSDNGGVGAISLGNSFRAIYGDFPQRLLENLYYDGRITAMSMDHILTPAEYIVQEHAPAHLARLSQKSTLRGSDGTYIYHSNGGNGVDVYLLDTGIDDLHPELEGRVQKIADLTSNPVSHGDPHGHGTAVAGVIGSATFGSAKKCNLFDVRVADSTGNATLIGVIRALEHASKLASVTQRPSVVVIPFTMRKNVILNSAIEAVIRDQSLPVVVAGGNFNQNACDSSPASAYGALTIGSIDVTKGDSLAPFTNYGDCIDTFAAGVNITSLTTGDYESNTQYSGTSISAGIASGVVAYYMSLGYRGMDAVNKVKLLSLPNVIPNIKQEYSATRNAVLQNM